MNSPRQQAFGADKFTSLPRYCRDCDVLFACHGGCPKDRLDTTPDGHPGLNHLCAGYQAFFRHIDPHMRTMAQLLNTGRLANAITAIVSSEDAKRSRNDRCPCDSGLKWKHCHGTTVDRAR